MPWEETKDYIRSGHGPKEDADTCRTIKIKGTNGIKGIYCKKAGSDEWYMQSFLFPKAKGWTMEKAKEWFSANNNSYHPNRSLIIQNIKLNFDEVTRTETDTHVIYSPLCFTKVGVMNRALKSKEEIEAMVKNYQTSGLRMPVTDDHPSTPWGYVSNWEEAKGYFEFDSYDPESGMVYCKYAIHKSNPEFIAKVDKKEYTDVSYGYFADIEELTAEMEFNDAFSKETVKYNRLEKNLFPNHLAGLPKGYGACSVKDGCGFRNVLNELDILILRNMSIDTLRDYEPLNDDPTIKIEVNTMEENKTQTKEEPKVEPTTPAPAPAPVTNTPPAPEPQATPAPAPEPAKTEPVKEENKEGCGSKPKDEEEKKKLELEEAERKKKDDEMKMDLENKAKEITALKAQVENITKEFSALKEKHETLLAVKSLQDAGVDVSKLDINTISPTEVAAFVKVNALIPQVNNLPRPGVELNAKTQISFCKPIGNYLGKNKFGRDVYEGSPDKEKVF